MSLERFRRTRLVVLTRGSMAYQAARAMTDNHIGSVLVSDPEGLAGIITDRDLALAVLGGDLDPKTTPLGEVMSEEVISCDIGANLDEADPDLMACQCTDRGEDQSSRLPAAASRSVTAINARGTLPVKSCVCQNTLVPPVPAIVQKNATSGNKLLFANKYARTGDDSDQAQMGVPITTKS